MIAVFVDDQRAKLANRGYARLNIDEFVSAEKLFDAGNERKRGPSCVPS